MTWRTWALIIVTVLVVTAFSIVATAGSIDQAHTVERIRRDEVKIQDGRYQGCVDSNRKWAELHAFLSSLPPRRGEEAAYEHLLQAVAPQDCKALVKEVGQ